MKKVLQIMLLSLLSMGILIGNPVEHLNYSSSIDRSLPDYVAQNDLQDQTIKIQKAYKHSQERQKLPERKQFKQKLQERQRTRDLIQAWEQGRRQNLAEKVQTLAVGYNHRTWVAFKKMLATVPYDQFRDLICSGHFLDETNWFYKFIELNFDKQIFKRNGISKSGNPIIDPKNTQLIDSSVDLDKLFVQNIGNFVQACLECFAERASHEIINNKMPWTQAVSITQDGKLLYPLGYEFRFVNSDKGFALVLGNIFGEVCSALLPRIPAETKIVQDGAKNLYVEFRAFGHYLYYKKEDVQSTSEAIESNRKEAIKDTFVHYCNDFLTLDVATRKALEYAIQPGQDPQKSAEENQDILNEFEADQAYLKLENTNWHLAAEQVFLLGQLFFENNLQAYKELGADQWLREQPTEMQIMVEDHLAKLKKGSRWNPATWFKGSK